VIDFWTDGSGVWDEKVPQPTGSAWVAKLDDGMVVECACWCPAGTNNTAELSAAIMALEALNPERPVVPHDVRIHTDSMYVLNQALRNHRTKANHALVDRLQRLQDYWRAQWIHVRGHSNNWGNERADVLAGAARKSASQATAYFTHIRVYHRTSPENVLLDKVTKPTADVNLEGVRCVLRLLI
jgi:ribonuclease HI